MPLVLTEIYLLGSLVLLKFGPIDWKINNSIFWVYTLTYALVFALGYFVLIPQKKYIFTQREQKWSGKKILTFFEKTYWIWYVVAIIVSWGVFMGVSQGFVTISNFFPSFINGIVDPAYQYYEKFKMVYGGNNLLSAFSLVFGFSRILIYFYTINWWNNISCAKKVSIVVFILYEMMQSISIGLNKNMIMVVFLLCVMTFVSICSDDSGIKEALKNRKYLIITLIVLCILAVAYFGWSTHSRINGNYSRYAEQMLGSAEIKGAEIKDAEIKDNENDFNISQDTDDTSRLKGLYIMFSSYICQGYKGMDMALEAEFDSGYGLGHSLFMSRIVDEFFGTSIIENTYNMKNEINYGWSREASWNSFYVWMANDVGFVGVIFIMFLYGALMVSCWKDVVIDNDFIAGALFVLLCCEFMWIPMHNFLGAFIEYVGSFWILLFVYIAQKIFKYSRKRKNYRGVISEKEIQTGK